MKFKDKWSNNINSKGEDKCNTIEESKNKEKNKKSFKNKLEVKVQEKIIYYNKKETLPSKRT